LWGYVKQKNSKKTYNDFEELKLAIAVAANGITPEMLENVFKSFIDRLRICIGREGGHVEPFM
jgi:ribulose 1,5-bisphosphate carboxylase large subunit-like protein